MKRAIRQKIDLLAALAGTILLIATVAISIRDGVLIRIAIIGPLLGFVIFQGTRNYILGRKRNKCLKN